MSSPTFPRDLPDPAASSGFALRRWAEALDELAAVRSAVDPDQVAAFAHAVVGAGAVHWGGHGRSGLVARALSMRFMHLGASSYVIGETATPGLRAGDAVVVISSSGTGSALAQATKASSLGARVVALTARAGTPVAEAADVVVVVPARSGVPSVQHAGSLFEQSCLLLGDSLCGALQEHLGISTEAMDRRHATLQ